MKKSLPKIIKILKQVGAIITDDHFVLTSGRHSDAYINKDALYPHPLETSKVGKMFAQATKDLNIETVIAPALGGIILSQWTAYHLTKLKKKEINGVYAEKKENGQFIISRGYDKYVKGKNVLVLEDLTATGGSVKKVVDLVKKYQGKVVAVYVMVNRDPINVTSKKIGAPFYALGEMKIDSWLEKDLPTKIKNRPINTSVGHGKKYLEKKRKKT